MGQKLLKPLRFALASEHTMGKLPEGLSLRIVSGLRLGKWYALCIILVLISRLPSQRKSQAE